jgi:hypothetical protein
MVGTNPQKKKMCTTLTPRLQLSPGGAPFRHHVRAVLTSHSCHHARAYSSSLSPAFCVGNDASFWRVCLRHIGRCSIDENRLYPHSANWQPDDGDYFANVCMWDEGKKVMDGGMSCSIVQQTIKCSHGTNAFSFILFGC